jgi:hypothetical protein
MPQFLIAIAILIGGYWLIKKSARMQPAQARSFATRIAGGGIVGLAGVLALRGSTQIAVPVFLFGLGLLGVSGFQQGGFKWRGERSSGQRSTVATEYLSMELNHDSGEMTGTVLKGSLAGRKLSDLEEVELRQLHSECGQADRQGLKLLEAWLDRNVGDWRATWSGKARNGSGSAVMSKEEALSVLGLKSGATDDEIRSAHRRLMKEYHPDRGGSDYLASKINAAKDLLLGA